LQTLTNKFIRSKILYFSYQLKTTYNIDHHVHLNHHHNLPKHRRRRITIVQ